MSNDVVSATVKTLHKVLPPLKTHITNTLQNQLTPHLFNRKTATNLMKYNRVSDYNQTNLDADAAIANYVTGDYHKLGKIALASIRILETANRDQTVKVNNRIVLQTYHNNIFTKHPCLVIKTDKVYYYTRNNVCKLVRGRHAHTHASVPLNKNQKKKMEVLAGFVDEKPANVLFCVMRDWVKTPYIQSHRNSQDSTFFMKEHYTNQSGNKSEIGIIESIVFNVKNEISYILNNGKVGWPSKKVIFPFVESYKNDFGKEIFYEIKKTWSWLVQMNESIET